MHLFSRFGGRRILVLALTLALVTALALGLGGRRSPNIYGHYHYVTACGQYVTYHKNVVHYPYRLSVC